MNLERIYGGKNTLKNIKQLTVAVQGAGAEVTGDVGAAFVTDHSTVHADWQVSCCCSERMPSSMMGFVISVIFRSAPFFISVIPSLTKHKWLHFACNCLLDQEILNYSVCHKHTLIH